MMQTMGYEDAGGGASRTTDPAAGTSAATDVSLNEYLSAQICHVADENRSGIAHLKELLRCDREAQKEANAKSLASIDKRFENVNEFRGALTDLSAHMATRDQVEGHAEKMEASVTVLESKFEALYQRNRGDIDQLTNRLNLREGEDKGARLTKGGFYTVIGLAIAFLTVLILAANYATNHVHSVPSPGATVTVTGPPR